MSDEPISSNPAIDAALQLDGDPEQVRQYYAEWAQSYDRDVGEAEYSGPEIAVRLFQQACKETSVRILDAGCGTGQVGVALDRAGFRHIDGFDLSAEMVDIAAASGVYQTLLGDIDMMRAAEDYAVTGYDAVLSIGVFTLGHVPPEALACLLPLLNPGGLLLVSTRSHYYEQTPFQQQVDQLLQSGRLEQLQVIWDAPYNHDGDAHYWLFRKLE